MNCERWDRIFQSLGPLEDGDECASRATHRADYSDGVTSRLCDECASDARERGVEVTAWPETGHAAEETK